jgi:hypothetical protein
MSQVSFAGAPALDAALSWNHIPLLSLLALGGLLVFWTSRTMAPYVKEAAAEAERRREPPEGPHRDTDEDREGTESTGPQFRQA